MFKNKDTDDRVLIPSQLNKKRTDLDPKLKTKEGRETLHLSSIPTVLLKAFQRNVKSLFEELEATKISLGENGEKFMEATEKHLESFKTILHNKEYSNVEAIREILLIIKPEFQVTVEHLESFKTILHNKEYSDVEAIREILLIIKPEFQVTVEHLESFKTILHNKEYSDIEAIIEILLIIEPEFKKVLSKIPRVSVRLATIVAIGSMIIAACGGTAEATIDVTPEGVRENATQVDLELTKEPIATESSGDGDDDGDSEPEPTLDAGATETAEASLNIIMGEGMGPEEEARAEGMLDFDGSGGSLDQSVLRILHEAGIINAEYVTIAGIFGVDGVGFVLIDTDEDISFVYPSPFESNSSSEENTVAGKTLLLSKETVLELFEIKLDGWRVDYSAGYIYGYVIENGVEVDKIIMTTEGQYSINTTNAGLLSTIRTRIAEFITEQKVALELTKTPEVDDTEVPATATEEAAVDGEIDYSDVDWGSLNLSDAEIERVKRNAERFSEDKYTPERIEERYDESFGAFVDYCVVVGHEILDPDDYIADSAGENEIMAYFTCLGVDKNNKAYLYKMDAITQNLVSKTTRIATSTEIPYRFNPTKPELVGEFFNELIGEKANPGEVLIFLVNVVNEANSSLLKSPKYLINFINDEYGVADEGGITNDAIRTLVEEGDMSELELHVHPWDVSPSDFDD